MPEPLFAVSGLNAFYGRAQVLEDVSFEMSSESIALVGRNGMGKTTLCNAIMGITPPRASGSIKFEGKELLGKPSYRVAGLGIGYVPQGRRLFPSLSVDEHLRMIRAPRDAGRPQLDREQRLRAVPPPRDPQEERRRAALRRRAADARDRARAPDQPEAADHGRAVRGPRARR